MTRPFKLFLLTASAALTLTACSGASDNADQAIETAKAESSSSEATSSNMSDKVEKAMDTDKEMSDSMSESEKPNKDNIMSSTDGSDVNASYNAFLETYVKSKDGINLVAYDAVKDEDAAALEKYIETLADTNISEFSDDEKMAYWFNLYNATTLNLILDNYPVDSIKDIDDPWSQKLVNVRGATMTLDEIEHDTLRENYDEPRIHFAVNCASIGCPNLKLTAWEASTLDADLTKAAKDYIASSRGIMVRGEDINASKIFDWYQEDFGSNEEETLNYLSQFATGEKKTAMQNADEINDYNYDWSLNIAK